MYKIKTLNKISDSGLSVLPKDKFTISDNEENPDGIILRSFDMHSMEMPGSLLAVARAGAGVNNVPTDKCSEKGIVVFNTPGANANAVKELVLAGLFLSSRDIVGGVKWVESLEGQTDVAKTVEKGKSNFAGPEITGKTLGVIGLGAIGILTANAAVALGMKVIGCYNMVLRDNAKNSLHKDVEITNDKSYVYEKADYISLNLPTRPETKKMFNAEVFNKMKKGARIINMARADLVNNDDLKAALESGQISCYVTDLPNEEVLGVKNVIPIPHLGASTPESEENCAFMAAQQIKNYLECGNIKNSVNFPELELECKGGTRICVAAKADACDKIASALEKSGLKVTGKASAVGKTVCYWIIDVEGGAPDTAVLSNAEGVISVRVIS